MNNLFAYIKKEHGFFDKNYYAGYICVPDDLPYSQAFIDNIINNDDTGKIGILYENNKLNIKPNLDSLINFNFKLSYDDFNNKITGKFIPISFTFKKLKNKRIIGFNTLWYNHKDLSLLQCIKYTLKLKKEIKHLLNK